MPETSTHSPQPPEQPSGTPKGQLQWGALARGHDRTFVTFQRPIGVTIACVTNAFIAVILVVLVLVLDNAKFTDWFAADEISPSVYFANLYIFAVFVLIAVFGMWEAAKWSWWLMVVLQVYSVVDVVGGMILNSIYIRPSVEQMSHPFRFVKDLVVSALWFLYFFTDHVLAYFQRSQERKFLIGCGVVALGAALACIKLAIAIRWRGI